MTPGGTHEVLRFPGMLRWGVVLCLGAPTAMAVWLWVAEARSPVQLVAPFVPFLVVWLLVARSHAREVVLAADGTVRVTTVLGRRAEAPLGQVRTRWARVPGATAYELALTLPDGPAVRVFQYPRAHTRRLTGLLPPDPGASA